MSQEISVLVELGVTRSKSVDIGAPKDNYTDRFRFTFADGTGEDQADQYWRDSNTVTSTPVDIDLETMIDPVWGDTINPARVALIFVEADENNTANITIGNDPNSVQLGFGNINDTWTLAPGDIILATRRGKVAAGWATTAGTGDIIQIVAASGTQTYRIRLVLKSA